MEKLTEQQIREHLEELKGWSFKDGFIQKHFVFSDFKETFSIMTRIAFECEEMNHHPNWENVYNNLTIRLNTHDVGGITENDINLAKTIESLVKSK
ncbi:4a-hydroxytetrahydrobiopterin dehydratase [Flagellimonas allohymeniacidonis]|uniref:Putative pterin-4-alpha-carbinolamine dehydratase n=1 Tax=Flagellimonas allohymeniacidonis TaxID=2517819 RepID=A0A4Q8QGH6_9FLAO|nr:4a-hydroxytetrahydrobiopterin dehydratase [Allomuricauda hymeniacidonis]TAI48328.1 4a-hydroxytetrahydrobiopterin dehydratase [Allomuricauda hymeniacidonis]